MTYLYMKINFLLLFLVLYLQINVADIFPKGHLKPLGSHRAAEGIDERFDIPTPLEFWNNYVKISRPVVFRGAAKHSKAFNFWTDQYLKQNYGNLEVRLERKAEKSGRVPIGAKGLGRDTIANFVDTYHEANNYIVSELPTAMWDDVSVQPCLTCGTFADRLVEVDLWMSGGGSKSLLHKDAFNAINCLYNGTKEWKMIEYKYEKMIYKAWEPGYEIGGFSLLDVDAVDLVKYPKLIDVPWSFVTVHAGDCLFLPKSYYHQVNSYGSNNIAVAILFSRLDNLEQYNDTGCESQAQKYVTLAQLEVDWKYPGHGTMTMGFSHLETAREMLKAALQRGPLTMESIPLLLKDVLHWKSDSEFLAEKIFNILSKEGHASVTEKDINSLGKEELRQLLWLIERYEPSNTYAYEYSYVRPQDISLLVDTLIKEDDGLILDKFVEAYKEHLGGTEAFALQIFSGFMSKNEEMATAVEVEQNLGVVLEPYVKYRKKAGIVDDEGSENDDNDNNDGDHEDDSNHDNDFNDNKVDDDREDNGNENLLKQRAEDLKDEL